MKPVPKPLLVAVLALSGQALLAAAPSEARGKQKRTSPGDGFGTG